MVGSLPGWFSLAFLANSVRCRWSGMARIGLTLYLVLASVAGPGFCCCVPGRLANMFAVGRGKTGQVGAATPRKSCCCHDGGSAPQGHQTPPRKHGRPGCPDSDTCPCKQPGLVTALLSQDAEQLNSVLVRSLLDGPAGLVPATSSTCLLSLEASLCGPGEGAALPFLSAHDYLTTHHILRC
jgi:hypothetical protein